MNPTPTPGRHKGPHRRLRLLPVRPLPVRPLLALPLLAGSLLAGACRPDVPFDGCEQPFDAHVSTDSPFLHQDGVQIVDGTGQPARLRTVNLGGWLHLEAWMLGAPLDYLDLSKGSESAVLARVEELYGAAARTRFHDAVMDGFITEADFAAAAAMGFDAVRLPLNHTLLDDAAGLARIDAAIQWAEDSGLRVVLDMHAAPGGQSTLFTADPDPVTLWEDASLQDELVEDWALLAARYASRDTVAGLDLLNEPDPPDDAALLSLYDRLLPAVRAVDPHHMLFIEGPGYSTEFDAFDHLADRRPGNAGGDGPGVGLCRPRRLPGGRGRAAREPGDGAGAGPGLNPAGSLNSRRPVSPPARPAGRRPGLPCRRAAR